MRCFSPIVLILHTFTCPHVCIPFFPSSLKSSVFDLVVAFFIGSYLYCLHMIFETFDLFARPMSYLSMTSGKKLKST
ncbi:unnamed protein product [Hymenolepis diminuta]|uniref:Uncharacterized protein n=1 Tax=Hymenolepis diminuta TaxID=6216 RepID=A0A564YGB9_HYMDI|nr:unnamed protein product [Hymenolepis diminuta]